MCDVEKEISSGTRLLPSVELEPDQEVEAVLSKGKQATQSVLQVSSKETAITKTEQNKQTGQDSDALRTKSPKDGVLWNSHPTVEPSLHFLAAQGEIARIKEEIEKGSDVNAVDKQGLTPLAWAAAHRQKATVSLLLKKGGNANVCSPTGEGALSFAACQGQTDVVEQLLQYGANPDIANLDGGTPLMYAAFNGHPHIVRTLLENGADLTAVNNEGQSALSLAVAVGNKHVQKVIEDYLRSVLENKIALTTDKLK